MCVTEKVSLIKSSYFANVCQKNYFQFQAFDFTVLVCFHGSHQANLVHIVEHSAIKKTFPLRVSGDHSSANFQVKDREFSKGLQSKENKPVSSV